MKIAIINKHFDIGGVETFLLSLIRQFKWLGHEVHVFLLEPDSTNILLPELQTLGVVIAPFNALRDDFAPRHRFDVAMVTNTDTFFEALRLLSRGGFEADRVIAGAYQTRMYCLDRGPFNIHNRLVRQLFSHMPVHNVIFGNDACRDEHAKVTPAMTDAPVIPLIVDGEKFPRRPYRNPTVPMRIVSIGRLDHFKTYNVTMPHVLRRLRDQGYAVTWDVYGTGVLQARMEQHIAELGLSEYVRLLGNVDYRQIPHVLNEAFAFVGSGLSMMEAAACGVPSLPAIEYADLPETFGFPHEIDGISFFEPGLSMPRYDLGDKLVTLITATPTEYEAIGDAGREKMSIFFPETVARCYTTAFEAATTERPRLNALPYRIFKISETLHRIGLIALKRFGLRKL